MKRFLFLFIAYLTGHNAYSQDLPQRVITTGVTFLNLHGDATQNMLAGISVVSENRATVSPGFYGNPALLSTGSSYVSATGQYMPWLRSLIPESSLSTVSTAIGLGKRHAIGLNARYFVYFPISPPSTYFSTTVKGRDAALQANYAYALTPKWSMGIALKYIQSDVGPQAPSKARVFASDIGVLFRTSTVTNGPTIDYSIGAAITDVGNKADYGIGNESFIPTSLKIGGQAGTKIQMDDFELEFSFLYQLQKLLVPTPPEYDFDFDEQEQTIARGYDPNVSVVRGMIQSFYDAPLGWREELSEYIHQFGMTASITYKEHFKFTVRNGIFLEADNKGSRKFYTLGTTIGYRGFEIGAGRYFYPLGRRNFTDVLEGTTFFSVGYSLQLAS